MRIIVIWWIYCGNTPTEDIVEKSPGAAMEQYYQGLFRHLSYKLGDSHWVADIVHDTYVRILEALRQQVIEHPQAYLYKTASNITIDAFRLKSRRRFEPLENAESEQGLQRDVPHDALYQQQRAQLVTRALAELSAPCRHAFLLRKLEGLSHQEIAKRMGISKDMVEKHIVNAMKHCRVRVRELE